MGSRISDRQIIARLEENDLAYGVFELQGGAFVIISQRGGHVFGPFLSQDSESLFWMNEAFGGSDAFKAFLDSGDWNLGGDRMWIAPEIQYHIADRADFWGTYQMPAAVDPGAYMLDQPLAGQWRLAQGVTMEAHNLVSGQKTLRLERVFRRAQDPLRHLSAYPSLVDGVTFVGYEQVVTLAERASDNIVSEAWSLVQLNPGGVLFIPAAPCVEFVDYYDPVGDLQTVCADHVRLQITGQDQYKVGYKAAHLFGRLGYFNHLEDGRAYLVVRNFFNNPSSVYAEEPAHLPGSRGYSVHVYNDGGQFGCFGELECNCQTIGGETGRSSSTDQLLLWIYVGVDDKVKQIGHNLLGVEL